MAAAERRQCYLPKALSVLHGKESGMGIREAGAIDLGGSFEPSQGNLA